MKNNKNNGFVRNPFLYLLIIVAAVTGFQYFFAGNSIGQSQQINYTELVKELKSDNVKEISYQPNGSVIEISGTYNKAKTSKDDTGVQFFTPSPSKVTRFTSVILPSDLTVQELQNLASEHKADITIKRESSSGMWITILTSIVPFVIVMFFFFSMMNQGGGGGARGAMNFGRNKARATNKEDIKVRFSDVAGAEEEKQELVEVVEFLKDPKRFTKLGARIPAGVLLEGPPGTGKTLLAKAVAGEAGVPFFSISGSDFVEMFVGVGASRVRDMFEQAKKNAPCIIFIDEIDAVGRQRGAGLGGGNDEREQTLNQLLVEMDGFESNQTVIVIAATNRPDVLDPALQRPGRFDRQVVVPLPDIRGREQILKVHAKKVPLDASVDLTSLARGTPGFSGADLANLVNEAALFAGRRNKVKVDQSDFEDAKDKIYMGPERRSMVMHEDEKRATAYHEAGHAIVAESLPFTDPVHKVTIMPRGRALGLTWQLPERDRISMYKDQMLSQLSILFGGRIAEDIFIGRISTGASNDFERATQMAREMVTRYGMSDKMGVMVYAENEGEVFLGRSVTRSQNISEKTQQDIDAEIRRILDEQYQVAYKILDENRDKMETMCKALMDWETIDRDQVLEIMAGKQPSPPKDYSHNVRDDKVEEPEAPVAEAVEPVEQNEVQNTESVEADKTDKSV